MDALDIDRPQFIQKFVIWSKVAIDLSNSQAEHLWTKVRRRIEANKRNEAKELRTFEMNEAFFWNQITKLWMYGFVF